MDHEKIANRIAIFGISFLLITVPSIMFLTYLFYKPAPNPLVTRHAQTIEALNKISEALESHTQ